MMTNALAAAQILFILVSDSGMQMDELTRELQRSRYRYIFSAHADKSLLVESVRQRLADNGGQLPVILLVNYAFAGNDCITLLELARSFAVATAIESVVTHPPALETQRQALLALGARLFDGEDNAAVTELMVH